MTDQHWLRTSAGVEMPPIIYGTAWKKERTAELVGMAINAGFRGIDTAGQPKHYDEALVGEALQKAAERGVSRDTLYLQTKFTPLQGQDPRNLPYDPAAPLERQVVQSLESSLHNLKTDYLDGFILHSPLASAASTMEVWHAMEKIYREGKARQLGISNCYSPDLLETLFRDATIQPAILQNRFYMQTGYDADLRRLCRELGILYQSFWTLTANPQILNSPAVTDIAREKEKTEVQIFFRCLTQSGIVPLTGTTSENHMREDLAIFDFTLSPEELEKIRRLFERQ